MSTRYDASISTPYDDFERERLAAAEPGFGSKRTRRFKARELVERLLGVREPAGVGLDLADLEK